MKMNTIFKSALWIVMLNAGIASGANLDRIVAIVDGNVITKSDLDKKISILKRQRVGNDRSLYQQALDDLIDTALQLRLAKNTKMVIGDKEVDQMAANIAKGNGLTIEQLKKEVVKQEGMSYQDFRRQLREHALIRQLQQQFLGGDITVTEKDIIEVLNNPPKMQSGPAQYLLTDIVIEVREQLPSSRLEKIKQLAKQLAIKIQSGVKVDKAVQAVEKDLQAGEQIIVNNELGWRRAEDLPALFAHEVVKMKVGQLVGPIIAPNGLHLLKLDDMHGGEAAIKLTKDQARDIAYSKKIADKVKPFLKELREKAYIQIMK